MKLVGQPMRLGYLIVVILSITLSMCPLASAVVEDVEGLFIVDYRPIVFELGPDEQGVVTFDIQNVDDESWMIALRITRVESGYTRADIHPSMFELGTNSSQRVTITFRTNAKLGQDPGTSDFEIRMYWGKDIVQHDDTSVDESTVVGDRSFRITVTDDLAELETFWRYVVLIILILAVIGTCLVIWIRRKTRPGGR